MVSQRSTPTLPPYTNLTFFQAWFLLLLGDQCLNCDCQIQRTYSNYSSSSTILYTAAPFNGLNWSYKWLKMKQEQLKPKLQLTRGHQWQNLGQPQHNRPPNNVGVFVEAFPLIMEGVQMKLLTNICYSLGPPNIRLYYVANTSTTTAILPPYG